MRVAVFRPEEYLSRTVDLLRSQGYDVLAVPMIGIEENDVCVRDADFTIITSQTAARIALRKNLLRGTVIAIGPKTKEALGRECLLPSKYDSKTLYEEFREIVAGKKVNLLRSDKGDPVLNNLSEVCDLEEYQLYRIVPLKGAMQKEAVREIAEGRVDAVIFSSSMIAESFMENARETNLFEKVIERLSSIVTVAIGPPTAGKLQSFGVRALIPEEYTLDGVISLLKRLQSA
ncbi:uroporphyrinogen-III synthase [Geoglobus acetivorans]|uniref:Uroporphyrinogen-III synthase n=1 Tax=Geoglobus acetivorans TaxID=565033 RepID=A0ABZ3H4T8_GEOAI|nr:uroporphyrinogen-III synthase [Geoglobus acetivorans]